MSLQPSRAYRRAMALVIGLLLIVPLAWKAVAAAGGPPPVTFVQSNASTTTSMFVFKSPVAAGDLVVAGITTNDGGTDPITGVSDTLNGSWSRATSVRFGNGHVELYYFANSAPGTDTVTFAGAGGAFTIAEYSGAGGLDQVASKTSSWSPTAGPTAALAGAGELVVGIGGMSAPNAFTAGPGYTLRATAVSNYLYANGLEDMVSSSSSGQSMALASSSHGYAGGVVAAFLPPTGLHAALAVSPASGAAPLAVTADASGSTDAVQITGYTFSFGDGSAQVGPQGTATTSHTYVGGGTFTVSVTATDVRGTTSSASQIVKVGAPVASLAVTPASGATPLSVTADASGSTDPVGISTYTFAFGDGTVVGPQSGARATHVYGSVGSYTATVTVQDSVGATATASQTVTASAPPTASLTVSPTSGGAPLVVTADASASTAGGNPIASYAFNFGDGTVLGPQSAAQAGHTFAAAGQFVVTVTVTDTGGGSSTASRTVTALAPPKAVLTVTPSSGSAPLAVTADASASSAGSNPIASYAFTFGDGATSGPQTAPTASHTYTTSGAYSLAVTVTDTSGLTSTATRTVNATTPPSAALAVTPSAGGTPLLVTADASASTAGANPIATYRFDFGDGTVVGPQSGAQATHTYTTAGVFTVTVSVTDTVGATSSASQTVNAQAPPKAALVATPASGSPPLAVTADASGSKAGTNPIASYTFNFGDGTVVGPQSAATAAHTYTSTGSFTVVLTVTDTNGLTGSASTTVSVASSANASVSGTVTDSVSASPIPGVTVTTVPTTVTTTTDAGGSYRLTVPAGTYTIVFTASATNHNANFVSGVQAPGGGTVAVPNQPLAPIPAQVAVDTYTQPDQSNGWATSTDGHVWSSDANLYPAAKAGITSRQAFVDTTATPTTDYDTWMGYQYQDQEVSVDLNITVALADPNYHHGARILARVQNSTSWVLMTVNPAVQDLELWATINGNWTNLGSVSQPLSTNTWYHVKVDAVGTLVRGKIWMIGTTEPGWLISANQTSVTGTGQGGLRTTGAYVQYANFMQTPITQITGTVTAAATGAPVVNATVSAGSGLTTVTDSRGQYILTGLLGGTTYTVTATASGFHSASASVTTSTGKTATSNLKLT